MCGRAPFICIFFFFFFKKRGGWSSFLAQQVKDLVFVTAVVQVTVVAWVQLLAWELPNTVGAANKK